MDAQTLARILAEPLKDRYAVQLRMRSGGMWPLAGEDVWLASAEADGDLVRVTTANDDGIFDCTILDPVHVTGVAWLARDLASFEQDPDDDDHPAGAAGPFL